MATRKRNAPKGKPKGSGGQSGGGNPRNDGRITEQQHDEAMRVLRAEYYQGVRGISQDIADRVKDGEISSQGDLQQAVEESVDGSHWVIYTHANFQVLMCSDHHDAYSEDFGQPPVEGDDIKWAALAYAAMMRDVQEQMSAEGVEINEDLEERRGSRSVEANRPLPQRLHAAWDWIDSAGEWDDAIAAPSAYAGRAARNAKNHDHDISKEELLEAIEWEAAKRRAPHRRTPPSGPSRTRHRAASRGR